MKAVLQRVAKGSVEVNGTTVGEIKRGMVIFLGVASDDEPADISYLVGKISSLRIFDDHEGKMNLSILDVGGEALCVSQFTLLGDCRKGRRPSFTGAASPDKARELYLQFCEHLRDTGINVATGQFQALMRVKIENDGPVTILLNSRGQA